MRTLAAVTATLALAGCATTTSIPQVDENAVAREQDYQKNLVVQTLLERHARLADLSLPILASNVELCGNSTRPLIGIAWATEKDVSDVGRPYRETMMGLGLGKKPMLLHVTAGSPAEAAGLRQGDYIEMVDGEAVPFPRIGNPRGKFTKQLDEAGGDGKVDIAYTRQGIPHTATVEPVEACDYPVNLVDDDSINAFADGNGIFITVGMYRFARTDLELQAVIAHEMAHNSEGHIRKKIGNSLLGAVVDIAAAAYGVNTQGAFAEAAGMAFSQSFEREADYVSLYMLERAGVDSSEASDFWRRMAMENPDSVIFARSHPTSAERFVNLTETHREIVGKRESGASIFPTRR